MGLLEEIQNEAVDSKSDLGQLLRKCKVLASRLGSKPLEDWLLWELDGYPKDGELPEYRVWTLVLKGHFSGPFGSAIRNAAIPRNCIPERLRESWTRFTCRYSAAVIEQMVGKSEAGFLTVPRTELAPYLNDEVFEGMGCIGVWGEFSEHRFVSVLNAVRNRILDFVLALEKEYPGMEESGGREQAPPRERVTQIFNTIVYGGAASVIGTASDSTINVEVKSGDWNSLAAHLKAAGIAGADLKALSAAVKAEPTLKEGGKFGPKVAGWVGEMLGKAATGAWDIAIGTGSALLTAALMKYYGLSA